VAVFGLLFVGGCNRTVAVDSRWAGDQIVVDGQDSEWRDGGMYYDEKTNTKIGIRNDAQYLYLCLIVKDEVIQNQILQKGFTLWISENKVKNKLWGLRYPVGGDAAGGMGGPGFEGPESGRATGFAENAPSGDREGSRDQGSPEKAPAGGEQAGGPGGEPGGRGGRSFAASQDFELLSSEDESGRVLRSKDLAELGIEGGFSRERAGGLVYEVKIPLKKTDTTPYAAVPSRKGGCLLGFVSEKAEGQGMGGGRGGRMGGGMDGGMGGGDPGRMGGGMNFSGMGDMGGDMGGGMGGEMGRGEMGRGGMAGSATVSSLELWALVELAAEPDSAT